MKKDISNPKVSIIMPFYNCEGFLEQAISPFKHIDNKKYEIILINDGSTDESLKVATEALCGSTIPYILIDKDINEGCFKARTRAIELSRGKYIAIADSDDVSSLSRLEKQLKIMENDESVFCCGTWAYEMDKEGNILSIMDYPPKNNKLIIKKILNDRTSNPIIDPTTMFRKSVFYELGGYSFSIDRNLVADMDLWFRALISDKVFVNIQEPLVFYRVNPGGNTVSKKREMIRQHVKVRNDFIKGIKSIFIE